MPLAALPDTDGILAPHSWSSPRPWRCCGSPFSALPPGAGKEAKSGKRSMRWRAATRATCGPSPLGRWGGCACGRPDGPVAVTLSADSTCRCCTERRARGCRDLWQRRRWSSLCGWRSTSDRRLRDRSAGPSPRPATDAGLPLERRPNACALIRRWTHDATAEPDRAAIAVPDPCLMPEVYQTGWRRPAPTDASPRWGQHKHCRRKGTGMFCHKGRNE